MEIRKNFKDQFITFIGSALSIVFIFALIINSTLIFKSVMNIEEIPHIAGIYPLMVLTDSMNPEFNSGDLIICKQSDRGDIHVGDVISYQDKKSYKSSIITHRVIEITNDENGLLFQTKGDANNKEDESLVSYEDVIGIYKMKIAGLGHIVLFMQSKMGLVVCVILPMCLLALYNMFLKKKDMDALKKELEQLKTIKSSLEKREV